MRRLRPILDVPYGVVRQGMTAANIREQYENFDFVVWPEQIKLIGNQTIDLEELPSKSSFFQVSGKPTLITDASTGLIIGNVPNGDGDFDSYTHAGQFYGELWIQQSNTPTAGTRAIVVRQNSYRTHFDQIWTQNWGGGIQGTRGEIKTLTIDRFFAWDFVAFGWEFFSDDYLKEISEIFINGMVEGNTKEGGSEGIYGSYGPGVGSAGKIGGVVNNGVLYRQKSVIKLWATREILSATWSSANGGQMTYVLEDYHSRSPGDNIWIGDFDNAKYNNLTGPKAITGISKANPGVVTCPDHGYTTGATIPISGVLGMTEVNNKNFTITVVDANSFSIGVNTTGYTTYTSGGVAGGGWIAQAGTTDKTIVVSMPTDPGAKTKLGYFTYHYRITSRGLNDYERPRKLTFKRLSGRGQRGIVFDQRAGANIVYEQCIADDAGVSDPNGLVCTATWSGGVTTYKTWIEVDGVLTPAAHTLIMGQVFNVRYANPVGYNVSDYPASVPDAYTFTFTAADDPGPMERNGAYYKPVPGSQNSHGWYIGPYSGTYTAIYNEAHENYGSAFYDDRLTNEQAIISNNRFFNSSYGAPNPPTPVADIYMRPGRANITITDNILGPGDTWSFSSKSLVFGSLPTVGEYVGFQLNASTPPEYYIFANEADPDSSQPQVFIGSIGTTAEKITTTILNLREAIHNRNTPTSNAVLASERDANLTQTGTIERLLLVFCVPGAVGKNFTIDNGSAAITLSPGGSALAGGAGQATASYGIMNVRDGERNNVVQRNQMQSHTIGETNMDPVVPPSPIRENLLDNGDFSLDQSNEGGSVTISSAGANKITVDRWSATRNGTDVTIQRVAGLQFTYGLKITGAAANTAVVVVQRLEGQRTAPLKTKVCVFSAYLSAVGTARGFLRVATPTALDNFASTTTIKLRQYVLTTTPQRVYFTFIGTSDIVNGLEVSFRFTDGVLAGQSVLIEGAKLENSNVITDFVPDLAEDTLFSCQRYYRKSFPAGTVPAQNAGVTGAVVRSQSISGAVAQSFGSVALNPPMRIAPSVTLYNPSAANANIRNTSVNADWSSPSTTVAVDSIAISGTGAAGGSAGNASAVHYTATAEFL